MEYIKKPIVIEAFQLNKNMSVQDLPSWCCKHQVSTAFDPTIDPKNTTANHVIGVQLQTLEGTMVANWGDWIIKGIKDELYPCKPEIFEATYDKVEE